MQLCCEEGGIHISPERMQAVCAPTLLTFYSAIERHYFTLVLPPVFSVLSGWLILSIFFFPGFCCFEGVPTLLVWYHHEVKKERKDNATDVLVRIVSCV